MYLIKITRQRTFRWETAGSLITVSMIILFKTLGD